jgi:hypothetical protein
MAKPKLRALYQKLGKQDGLTCCLKRAVAKVSHYHTKLKAAERWNDEHYETDRNKQDIL